MPNATAVDSGKSPVFCVLGAGHGGLAMAGHLAIMGFTVNLFNRTEERIWAVRQRGGVELQGEIEGFGKLNIVTHRVEEAIRDAEVLMIVVPATAHRYLAETCAPHLKDGQIIILNPGRTLGAIEFKQVLKEKGCTADVVVSEAQTLIYASRATNPGQAKIFRIKNSVPLASIPAYKIPDVLKIIRTAYPQFAPGTNVLRTSFDNIGAIFHPGITVLNSGWIEDKHDFEFYVQGASISVCRVLEKLDEERVAVAAALGINSITAREWLYRAYDVSGRSLYEAMMANVGYRGILAPSSLNVRYLTEDVPMSLVPVASLGEMLGVGTPTTKSLIHLASMIQGVDYWAEGRTVEKLKIAGLSVKDLRLLAIGEEGPQ
ncbi:MAG: NAD/NADP octopine/nopaline dehydrogenase family protein [Candidatus Aminicenantes bacterium]|nr:NAD/NADP octopine/nopaline dehydrogenase family protein [Candidatus Aminicenantes bacterium]